VDEILKRIDAEVTEEDGIFTLKVKGWKALFLLP
jgi:hypothetical protein